MAKTSEFDVINLITGTPGAGKTYFTIFKTTCPALKNNEIYFLNFDGINKFIDSRKNYHSLNWMAELHQAHAMKNGDIANKILAREIKKKDSTITPEYYKTFTKNWDKKQTSTDAVFLVSYHPKENEIDYPDFDKWLPPGSMLIIDEAQTFFDIRNSNFYKILNTARHAGYRIILITPNPSLLSPNCTKNIGSHWILDKPLGSWFFRCRQFQGYQGSKPVTAYKSRKDYITKESIFFTKKIHSLYKSSENESKQIRLPTGHLWLIFFLLIICFASLYFAITTLTNMGNDNKEENNEEENEKNKIKKTNDSFQLPITKSKTSKWTEEARIKGIHQPITHTGIGDTFCDVSPYDIQLIGYTQTSTRKKYFIRYKEICHTLTEKNGDLTAPISEIRCHFASDTFLKKYGYQYIVIRNTFIIWRADLAKTNLYLKEHNQQAICLPKTAQRKKKRKQNRKLNGEHSTMK